ncbi:MAG: hypothetical protein WCT28_04630 [Patescibacteria group bacterium]|jgi:hypothetical protein
MRFWLLLILIILGGFGCTATSPISIQETVYTSFIINTHDWTQPEESIATINRIIDLHELYKIPVDIYLTDPMVQLYVAQAPELIERLKTSPYVAVSYHLRPPTPYYAGFHEEIFNGLSENEIKAKILEYEEHAIDLKTGEPTDRPGGYQYLKDLIGYAPIVIGSAEGKDKLHKILDQIYKEKGATFTLQHNTIGKLGDTFNGLFLRPENLEIKVYERKDEISVDALMADALKTLTNTRPTFLNVKWHENNFYSSGTGWSEIYFSDGNTHQIPLNPPYSQTISGLTQTAKTHEQQLIQWERYEALMKYVKDRPETFTTINAKNLLDLIKVETQE